MVEEFDDHPHLEHRALQIWQILISCAHNRQTINYEELADVMGFGGPRPLYRMLGHVAAYCALNGLPLLSTLTVNKESGAPTEGTFGRDPNKERERVFRHPWFQTYPPAPEEFAEVFAEANKRDWDLL